MAEHRAHQNGDLSDTQVLYIGSVLVNDLSVDCLFDVHLHVDEQASVCKQPYTFVGYMCACLLYDLPSCWAWSGRRICRLFSMGRSMHENRIWIVC